MQLNSYLFFNGQCEEAFKFYEQCLGGKIEAMLPHEGSPAADHVPRRMAEQDPARTDGCRRPGINGFRRSPGSLSGTARLFREHWS